MRRSHALRIFRLALSLSTLLTSLNRPSIATLFEGLKADVDTQLDRGFNMKWTSTTEVEKYVAHMSDLVTSLKANVDHALAVSAKLDTHLATLKDCAFSVASLKAEIDSLTSLCATLNFGYSKDLKTFVANLNSDLEKILLVRLTEALTTFSTRVESPSTPQSTFLSLSSTVLRSLSFNSVRKSLPFDCER